MSEASNVSPSPTPTTSGDDTFAPTITPESSADIATIAYAPRSSRTVARTASGRPSRRRSSSRCAMHSVSVSDANVCPSFSSRARSGRKFSMIPLWITATRPVQSTCGCALRSVGAPWVAHRVWPKPTVPAGPPDPRALSSSESFPARFTTVRPPSTTATPAES